MLLTPEQASVLYSNVELQYSEPIESGVKYDKSEIGGTDIADLQKTIKESLDTINGLAKENRELRARLEGRSYEL